MTLTDFKNKHPNSIAYYLKIPFSPPKGAVDNNNRELPTHHILITEWCKKNLSGEYKVTKIYATTFIFTEDTSDQNKIAKSFNASSQRCSSQIWNHCYELIHNNYDYLPLAISLGYVMS